MKNVVPILQEMFPNCKEVKDLKLGPNKLNYGIYPYFQEVLKNEFLQLRLTNHSTKNKFVIGMGMKTKLKDVRTHDFWGMPHTK